MVFESFQGEDRRLVITYSIQEKYHEKRKQIV
jgi:hypothetical protein